MSAVTGESPMTDEAAEADGVDRAQRRRQQQRSVHEASRVECELQGRFNGSDNFLSVDAQHIRNFKEFHQINTAFPALVFGDKGLGASELFGQSGLCQARLLSRRNKAFAERTVGMSMDRFSHVRGKLE